MYRITYGRLPQTWKLRRRYFMTPYIMWNVKCQFSTSWNHCDNYVPQWWVEFDDELSWLFTKRFKTFYPIYRKCPNPSQNFCFPIFLTFIYLVALNLLVNNQLNSSLWHIIVTLVRMPKLKFKFWTDSSE